MKLHLNAFKISLSTNRGPHGVQVDFTDGLNVIRAENTSGKSALLNGILYALGLEALVGKRGVEATKPVLHTGGDYDGQVFNVTESYVELELSNGEGIPITVRRWIKGGRDERLVEVIHAPALTGLPSSQHTTEAYFVGIEGAAQRERGFHQFLAEFLNLELPRVKRSGGHDVPLYMECIFPLMFIEQVRGWSGIQASLRHSFGIRNVAKLAVEYVMGLDVIANEQKRIEIADEAARLREEWTAIRERLGSLATQAEGNLRGVPTSPTTTLTDDPWICIVTQGQDLTIDDILVELRGRLPAGDPELAYASPGNDDLNQQLETYELELLVAQAALSQVRLDIRAEEAELIKLREREAFTVNDIRRNRDIKRLRDFGMNNEIHLADNRCPTCNQEIEDTLVPSGSAVMTIKENIHFLETEKDAIYMLIEGGVVRSNGLRERMTSQSGHVVHLRNLIRDLRSDLLSSRNVSTAAIREHVHLQEKIAHIEALREDFGTQEEELQVLTVKWNANRGRYSELPDDYFSSTDRDKLSALTDSFDDLVSSFGYRSTSSTRLRISQDNYRPICDDFEVSFGASASDNIRLIWAYTLGLLRTSLSHNGNHWGLVVFDEPEQQQMRQASSDALYARIAEMATEQFQVIVATSAPEEVTNKRLQGIPHNLLEFGDKVIRLLPTN